MSTFRFKQFAIDDHGCGMKICSDSVLLGAWASLEGASRILDLGAGSGLLALMCAQRTANAAIEAVEIDHEAAKAAAANFAASPWASRLKIVCADASTFIPEDRPDLIICNPPYFTSGMESPDAQRAAARHAKGLSPVSAIEIASAILTPEGSLAMVTPAECQAEVTCQAEMQRLKIRRICMVRTSPSKKPTRMLWQIGRIDGPIEMTELWLRDSSGAYSQAHQLLTSDFYL